MTTEILHKMEERRKYKDSSNAEGQRKYKQLKVEIQRQCIKAKTEFYNQQCSEIEQLEKEHNPVMYKKIKEMTTNRTRCKQGLKDKDGVILRDGEIFLNDGQNM